MALRYRYRTRRSSSGHFVRSVLLNLTVERADGVPGTRSRVAKLDPGADFTAFPRSIADQLGIDLYGTPAITLAGIGGGKVTGSIAKVRLSTVDDRGETAEWEADVAFCHPDIALPLAGYVGFGEFFDIHFETAEAIVEPRDAFPGTYTCTRRS